MRSLLVRTCAKVNLFLRVLGKRPDGYHEIETLFQGIGLCDDLGFSVRPEPGIELHLERGMPRGSDNLIARAWALLGGDERTDGVEVRVEKRIPLGAGLGGGSSNAAGTLLALNELWRLRLEEAELGLAGLSLGSDVPFFLQGGTALGRGRGEVLTRLPDPPELWFVLGISNEPLSTQEVYERWRPRPGTPPDAEPPIDALRRGDVRALGLTLHNDLEETAMVLRPELRAKKAALLRVGALGACVSGSGPTLFALATDRSHASSIAGAVQDEFDRVAVTGSVGRCVELPREGKAIP